MEFLGDIEGNGVDAVRLTMGKILRSFPQVENAYFLKLKYKEEDTFRIALIIDSSETSHAFGEK